MSSEQLHICHKLHPNTNISSILHGKILEDENFSQSSLMKKMAQKTFGESACKPRVIYEEKFEAPFVKFVIIFPLQIFPRMVTLKSNN